jgi:CRP/FNR family cyclic AMP-dependent transcriptional regulator
MIARDTPGPGGAESARPQPIGSSTSSSVVRIAQILRADPDLAEAIPAERREQAISECIAPITALRRGRWSGAEPDMSNGGIGLLVLDGLLVRRVGIDGRFGAELLGQGDLLRPWQGEDAGPTLLPTTGWRVLETTQVAQLDLRVARRLARYPELTGRLAGRALQRSRNLAVNMAIVHQPRVEIRLHMLLWHLASRWGRVRGDGVLVPLRLTHTVLADLVAARRPTVSTALAELGRQGILRLPKGGWLLVGDPPGELLELGEAASPSALRQLRSPMA